MEGKYLDVLRFNCYARKNIICDSISIKYDGICENCRPIISNTKLSNKDLLEKVAKEINAHW